MRILVTGAGGQLGHDCVISLKARGHDVLAPPHQEMDICDGGKVESYFTENHPEAVVHCAAWTAVDLAEDEPDRCREVNVGGTSNIAEMCGRYGIPMMYFSTDYVFNGKGTRPWKVDDPTGPISVYGKSKRDGEVPVRSLAKHFIVRISWVFGVNGKNFIRTMLRLASSGKDLRVVDDQIGSPTYTKDLAELVSDMIVTDRYGIYHAHNSGECSWYELAMFVFETAGLDPSVEPITTDQFPMKAARPMNSRMDMSSLSASGFREPPDWKDAVRRYLKELDDCGRWKRQ